MELKGNPKMDSPVDVVAQQLKESDFSHLVVDTTGVGGAATSHRAAQVYKTLFIAVAVCTLIATIVVSVASRWLPHVVDGCHNKHPQSDTLSWTMLQCGIKQIFAVPTVTKSTRWMMHSLLSLYASALLFVVVETGRRGCRRPKATLLTTTLVFVFAGPGTAMSLFFLWVKFSLRLTQARRRDPGEWPKYLLRAAVDRTRSLVGAGMAFLFVLVPTALDLVLTHDATWTVAILLLFAAPLLLNIPLVFFPAGSSLRVPQRYLQGIALRTFSAGDEAVPLHLLGRRKLREVHPAARALCWVYVAFAVVSFGIGITSLAALARTHQRQTNSFTEGLTLVWLVNYLSLAVASLLFIWMDVDFTWQQWGWAAIFLLLGPAVGLPWYLWLREHALQEPEVFHTHMKRTASYGSVG